MKNKMPIDKDLLYSIRLAHEELPRLTEQDVLSIKDLLTSEDPEVNTTGFAILNTFNIFLTPETIYRLYECTNINEESCYQLFTDIIRLLYADSERFEKETINDDIMFDKKLSEYVGLQNW